MPIQKPSVTVEQVYAAVDIPRLDPDQPIVIIAPCYDVLDATDSSNAANANAAMAYPGYILANAGPYVAVGDTDFTLRVNNGTPQTVRLPGTVGVTDLTAASVAAVLNSGTTGIQAFDIGGTLLIVTSTTGSTASLEITAAHTAFYGATMPPISYGADFYDNNQRSFPFVYLPDPYNRMDDLVLEADNIDIYLLSGGVMRKLEEEKALLGSADRTLPTNYNHPADDYTYVMSALDDNDGDLYTPYMVCWGAVATNTTGTPLTDAITWTAAGKDHGGTGDHGDYHGVAGNSISVLIVDSGLGGLVLSASGTDITIDLGGATVAVTDLVDAVNDPLDPAYDATVASLVSASTTDTGNVADFSQTGTVTVGAGTAAVVGVGTLFTTELAEGDYISIAGETIQVLTITDDLNLTLAANHVAGAAGVAYYLVSWLSGGVDPLNFQDTEKVARVTGDVDWSATGTPTDIFAGETAIFRIDGGIEYTATMSAGYTAGDSALILADLNATGAGAVFSTVTVGTAVYFRCESGADGVEGVVHFVGGTALPKLFGVTIGVTNSKYYGRPHAAAPGDSLWYQGTQKALISTITPLLVGTQSFTGALLKLSQEFNITTTYPKWYMIAEDLTVIANRPAPEVTIDGTTDEVRIRQAVMYDSNGNPYQVAIYPTYVAYKALRLDVTQAATTQNPTLTAYAGLTELAADMNLTSDNPLGMGLMKAMAVAPENVIYGLGLDEVSDAEPGGTYLSYARMLDFLATRDVYFMIVYSMDEDVHVLVKNHCEAMSAADVGKWRVAAFTEPFPTEEVPYLMGSGSGNTVVTTDQLQCDVSELNLINAILAQGLNPAALTYDDGVFVRIEDQRGKWLVTSVDNVTNTATLSINFSYPDNSDGFYSTTLPDQVVDKTVSLYLRGSVVTSVRDKMTALADMAGKYESKRAILAMPDQCATSNSTGGEERLSTFYALCDIAGTKAKFPTQEPLSGKQAETTSFVYNSNDVFPEKNGMDIAAAGGIMWFYNVGGVVRIWRQKTTDTTSIEREEISIVSAIDYVSKYVSLALQPMLNKNIDDTYLDELGILTESIRDYLENTKKCVRHIRITRMEQDTDDPTLVYVDMTVVPLYPAVEIRVQLNIQRTLS